MIPAVATLNNKDINGLKIYILFLNYNMEKLPEYIWFGSLSFLSMKTIVQGIHTQSLEPP